MNQHNPVLSKEERHSGQQDVHQSSHAYKFKSKGVKINSIHQNSPQAILSYHLVSYSVVYSDALIRTVLVFLSKGALDSIVSQPSFSLFTAVREEQGWWWWWWSSASCFGLCSALNLELFCASGLYLELEEWGSHTVYVQVPSQTSDADRPYSYRKTSVCSVGVVCSWSVNLWVKK